MLTKNIIDDKFLGVAKDTILYLTKDNVNIMVKLQNSDENLYKFFNVNESGRKIFEEINGKTTIKDFIVNFCSVHNLEYEKNKKWIAQFIIEMIQKKALRLSNLPIEDGSVIHQGRKDCISPMHATIEITEKCNLRCKHCYLEADIKKTSIIDYDRFVKLVDTLVENNVVNIEITGGEIFMHPRIADILKLCYKKFAMVGVLTNGTIMTSDVLEILEAHKDRTVVNVSVDDIDPDIHDEFRGMKGAWAASCNTIKILSQRGIKVRMASSISKDNMWSINKLADLAISLGAAVFSFNFIEEFGRGAKMNHGSDYLDVIKYNDYINKVVHDYKDIIPIIKEEDRSDMIKNDNCGSGSRSIVIGADGYIRPCPLSPKVKFIGNVFDEEFTDIFEKTDVKKLADIAPPDIRNGCDANCKYIHNCHGCYIKGFEKNKTSDTYCSWIIKNHLEDTLKLFKGQSI